MLVFQRDEVEAFGGRRRLVYDSQPDHLHVLLADSCQQIVTGENMLKSESTSSITANWPLVRGICGRGEFLLKVGVLEFEPELLEFSR